MSNPSPTQPCPKCGEGCFKPEWVPAIVDEKYPELSDREHLRYTCLRCGFFFDAPCKDVSPSTATTPADRWTSRRMTLHVARQHDGDSGYRESNHQDLIYWLDPKTEGLPPDKRLVLGRWESPTCTMACWHESGSWWFTAGGKYGITEKVQDPPALYAYLPQGDVPGR